MAAKTKAQFLVAIAANDDARAPKDKDVLKETFEKAKFYATFGGLPIDALTSGKGKEFVDKYTALYKAPPADAYATYGYEAALVTLEAIRRAGKKDRDAIRTAALAVKNFEGATGTWSFDANGDTTNQTMSGSTVVTSEATVDGSPVTTGAFKFVRALQLPPKK